MERVHSRSFMQDSFAATNDQLGATRDLNAGSTSAEDKVLHKEGVGAWIIRKIAHIFFAVMAFFGSNWAQLRLGVLYLEDSNQEKGLYWVEKSAENKNITAQFRLGEIFYTGKYGVEKDKGAAIKWLEKVIGEGWNKSITHSELVDKAIFRLADILLKSHRDRTRDWGGIGKDPERVLELLLRPGGLVERKSPEALRIAGEILKDRYSDEGAIPDLQRAIEFLVEAQDLGCDKKVVHVLDEAFRLRDSAEASR